MKPKVGDYIKTIRNSAVGNNVIAKVRFINYEDRLGFGKFKNYYSCWREDNSWFELTDNDFKKGRAIVIKKQKEVIDKAIELTKNLLKTEDRGYYQILFKEILKSLGDKENGR